MARTLSLLGGLIAALLATPTQAHDAWADGKPIPDWVKSSCCGPADAHHLRPDQVLDMGDYYIVDGYQQKIRKRFGPDQSGGYTPNNSILPSQDGDYWIFYSEDDSRIECAPYAGSGCHRVDASQSGVYCFFVPMDF